VTDNSGDTGNTGDNGETGNTGGNDDTGNNGPETSDTKITILDLSGQVIAPAKGAAPVATGITTTQYTGTVAWQTENGDGFDGVNFEAGTVYQAVVTLTAKEGYTFTGVGANSFTHTGAASITNAVNSGAVTIVFPATADASGPRQFNSLADLSAWLDEQEANAKETPYEAALTGVALSVLATADPADPLGALFAALHGRYVALDLSGCTGTAIGNSSYTASGNRTDKDKLVSLVLPSTLTDIGDYAFYQANGLGSVDLSGTAVTNIGSYAFSGCTALGSVELSDTLTAVSEGLFFGCSSLTVVDLPASVTAIEFMAFQNCTGLSALIIRRTEEAVALDNSVFSSTSNFTSIYVPDTLVDTYKTAANWKSHAGKIKGLSALPQ
jgi:hypothetical protein